MEEVIKAVLVDDDRSSILVLRSLLGSYFPKVEIGGKRHPTFGKRFS